MLLKKYIYIFLKYNYSFNYNLLKGEIYAL